MPELGLDFETRGIVDLRRSGAHRYAVDADADVLCAAFAKDDAPVESWVRGTPCPEVIIRAVADGWTIHAFNANFERLIWHHILTPRLRLARTASRSMALHPGRRAGERVTR